MKVLEARAKSVAGAVLGLVVLFLPGSVHAQCTCPATDTSGNALVNTGMPEGNLLCDYPTSTCTYSPVDGSLLDFLGNTCPATASCPPPPETCGNGIVEGSETCDDGNTLDGDCCSSTCELQDCSVAGAKDSFLRHGKKNANEGANALLSIRQLGRNRVVVGFDLASLDTSAVASARLVLAILRNPRGWGPNGAELAAYALTQDFTEGNGHVYRDRNPSRGSGPGVTYRCATDTAVDDNGVDCNPTWDGGAFTAAPSDTALVTNATTGTVEFDVTGDVQAGRSGWLIKTEGNQRGGSLGFHSREGAAALGDSTLAPRLELDY